MLSFCIPTWNRAEKLRSCLESIGELTKGFPVDINVYNNASTDHTLEVLEDAAKKYRVNYKTGTEHVKFDQSYANAVRMATQEWTWTFGDDDLLLDFETVIPLLMTGIDFIHVTEKRRSNGNQDIYPGKLLDLCSSIGWIEMTGFISGDIFRTAPMQRVISSDRYSVYGKSAFPQSLAALEAFHDKPAMLLDVPLITLQDDEQTPESAQRWGLEKTALKYADVADGLKLLNEIGVIPDKLSPEFFRYLSGSFIAKCMHSYWSETINTSKLLDDSKWDQILYLSDLFDGNMRSVVEKFRVTLSDYCEVCEKGMKLVESMEYSCAEATPFTYPETYI